MQPRGRKAGERSQIPLAEVSRMDKDIDEPGDRDELDELDDAAEPWPPTGYPPPRNATRRRGRRAAALAATAVRAARHRAECRAGRHRAGRRGGDPAPAGDRRWPDPDPGSWPDAAAGDGR